jgi:glycerophosphoryl diester phosphodiesterase
MISPNDNLVNRVVSTIPNQIINKENDYKKIFSNFLNYTGIAQGSSSWDLYVFPILSPKIKVRTYMAGVGAENTSKLAWVMLDLPYELSDNYTEENIIRKSIIYGGSFIGEISNAKYVNHVVDVPKGALSIVVAVSKEASYIPRVEPCESNGLDKADLISDDINLAYPVGVWRDWNDMSANIISAYAKYTGEKSTIGFNSGNIYRSISYILGNTNFSLKSWRVPARKDRDIEISINVPMNSTLEIKDISLKMNDGANPIWQGGCKLTAHLGFQQFAPENSMIAFELAHRFNYPACVANPIISKDGTIYCYHQGDSSLSLDGKTPIALTIEEFSSLTDEQISNYKVIGLGNVVGKFLEDIPTFESFVALCAKTGMRIVISTHPILTEQQWLKMKTITDKYNMTHLFTIKSFSLINLENAYSIFKDKIEGYIYDVGSIDFESIITQVKNSIVGTEVRFGIEYPANIITKESVVNTMAAGYFVSAWDVYRISGERYEELIQWGVSEFTDDNNCCSGLNW